MKTMKRRILSGLLAILMILQCFMLDVSSVSASASTDSELSNWSIRLDFLDDETGTLTNHYDMTQDGVIYSERQVTLQVSIEYTGDGSVTYAAEDVSFELSDIRDMVCVDMDDDYTYDVAAELKGSNSGRGDWYYEVDEASRYDIDKNTFTFTNKEAITGAFTSTFQIIMEPYPLSCAQKYKKDFTTALTFKNMDGSVSSNTASFTYTGTKSTYEILASYIEIEAGVSDEIIGRLPDGKDTDDYIFAHVQVEAPYVSEKIANIYLAELTANFPSDVIIGNHNTADINYSGIFTNPEFSVDENNALTVYAEGYNNYLFPEDPGVVCLGFYVAFPREKYINLGSYKVPFTLTGAYLGETSLSAIDSYTLNFNFSEFNYVWEAGELYIHTKNAYNTTNPAIYRDNIEDNYIYENMVYSYDHPDYVLHQDYIINMTTIYTGEPYDVLIGDDLSYYIYEDNTYRKVKEDERFATEVHIPAKTGASAVEIYGRKPGSDTYELYGTYSGTLSSSKDVKLDTTYCDIQVKFVGLADSIQARKMWIYYAYTINTDNDNGKIPIKVYNFSYMDVTVDGTAVAFDRERVTTNITGLDKEIDAFDKATYGGLKYRSTDYKTILRSVAGLHQSRGSQSTYNGKKEITDDQISILYSEAYDFYDYQGGGNTWCDFTDTYVMPEFFNVDINEIAFFSYDTKNYFYFENGDTVLAEGKVMYYKDLPEELKSQISIEMTTLSDGSKQLTIHYDFKDNKLVNQSELFYFFMPYFTITIDRDTYEMRNLNGKRVDMDVIRTINQDSNTLPLEYTTRDGYEALYLPTIAYSTYQGVSLESATEEGLFNNSDKSVEPGNTYEYKLMLHTGNSKAKYVTFFDTLDGAYETNSYWQGTFLGVDVSDLEALGASPKIYYSTNAAQAHDLSKSGWTLSTSYTGSLSNVKAVAIDLGDYVIDANSLALVKIKMQATSSSGSYPGYAYNNGSVSYKAYDTSLTNLTTSNYSESISGLTSNTTKISIESAVYCYIDGINGNDSNSGLTASSPVKTFKQAYTNIQDKGGTIYVVDTVPISKEMTLASTYYKDSDGTVSITDGFSVIIRRYSKPTIVNDGFDVDSHLGILIQVESGGKLTLTDITVDGHRNALEEGTENEIAVGVDAENAMLRILEGGTAYLTDATLQNNKNVAYVSGGAVSNAGTFVVTDGVITNNYADYHGAGIYNTGSVTLKSSSDSTSTVISHNETDYNGGGIYNDGSLEFIGSVLIDSNLGSGIFTCNDLVLPEGVEISNNGEINGAGVYVKTEAKLTIDGALIHDNYPTQSWGDGSGIFAEHYSVVTLNSGKIYNNGQGSGFNASDGGGICLNGDNFDDVTTFIMNGGEIYGNAASYGGGIALVGNVRMTMNSGEIYDNTAECGGGVYLGQYGKLSESTFKGDASVHDNTATESGGGVYSYMCIVNVEESSLITNNTAGTSGTGGGIYIEEGTLNMSGGTVSLNDALDGGGVYNAAGTFTMSGGKINNNTASQDGGGIYNTDLVYSWGTYYGVTTLTGGTITNNTASNNGHGFYQNGTLYMNTNGKVATNNDVYLPTDRIIIVNGMLSYTDIGAVITPSDYTLGRTVVRTEYMNDSNTDALASEVYARFTLTPKDYYCLRPGDYIHDTVNILDTDVVISRTYSISYNKNLDSESVSNMPANQVKYWNEETKLSELVPTCTTMRFVGWDKNADLDLDTNTPAYSTGSTISYDINEDLLVYAQWLLKVYDITYEMDGGENHPDNPDSYTYGEGVPEFYDPTKPGHEFQGWYEDEDFTTPITSIDEDRMGDVTLYPKWSRLIQVTYNGNGSDSGSIKTEVISELDCANKYIIKANTGFTDFAKEKATFSGWDITKTVSANDTRFTDETLPKTITFDDLEALIDNNTTTTVNGVKDVAVVTLYAVWDLAPSLSVTPADDPDNTDGEGTTDPDKGSILTFYEGETVTKEMLLENVIAKDTEDGNITENIRIIKITYSAGKVVGDEKLPSYTKEWTDDMPDTENLDTWFLQLAKEDSPVTHTITYAVTDSAGNETTLDWTVKVKYNEAPEITAEDRYFTLKEAQDGVITKELLLSEITASDKEDDALYGAGSLNDNVAILSFDPDEFKNFTGSGYVVLTLSVHDSMGPEDTCDCVKGETSHPVGKETIKQIVIYIVDGDEMVDGPDIRYVRFIDEHYYRLNQNKYSEGLSDTEIDALNKNGGLHIDSKWYLDESYRTLIEESFGKTTASMCFSFDESITDDLRNDIIETSDSNGILITPDDFWNMILPFKK